MRLASITSDKPKGWTLISMPLIPLFVFFIERSNEFSLIGLVKPILVIIILSVLLTFFLKFFLAGKYNRSLLANLLLYLLIDYSSVAALFLGPSPVPHFLILYGVLWILLAIILVLAFRYISSSLIKPIKVLGLVSVIFVSTLGIKIGQDFMNTLTLKETDINTDNHAIMKGALLKKYPSIIYIVLDEYTRSDMLKREFGFDNSSFIDSLKNIGFNILNQSRSNYWTTPYSLASSMNMNYLDSMLTKDNSHSWVTLTSLINRNDLIDTIRDFGGKVYSTNAYITRNVYFGNFDSCLQLPSHFERLYDVGYSFWSGTAFHPLAGILSRHKTKEIATGHKRKIEDAWQKVKQNKVPPTNSFVFAHLLAPHPPFLFNGDFHIKDGNYIGSYPFFNMSSMSDSLWVKGYSAQIDYVNQKALEVIDSQLSKSIQPIIIIQSDHGMRNKIYQNGDYNKFDSDYLMRFTNFSAVYFPDQDYSMLYDSMSNVNTWRVVLNKYFGTEMEMLPDRNFDIDFNEPFKFIDITDRLDSIENSL
jgi:hypothetical protein